ncbi:hypothetical protein Adt_17813 [Abeliophyllum distichum]|uniref:Uncharacterized protein n=1 Tax=Abeliophyllum distichum TaxID=126358 RepID=A0ABD1THZ6_9LAMI
MINCSRLSPTTEETRSWQPNNKSTRGLAFNARTALEISRHSTNLVLATRQALSLFHPKNEPRSSVSPTGTRQALSLFHPKERASLKCLSHWDSAITQLVPSRGTSLAQVPLPLGLGNHSACSIQRNEPHSSASPTGTRQALSLFHPKERASLKRLSHWDSASTQLVPSKGASLAQAPLPLGLGKHSACSIQRNENHSACSIQRNEPRSSASPTGTRQSLSLFHPKEQALLNCFPRPPGTNQGS